MKTILIEEIKKALSKLNINDVSVEVSKPAKAENGDFASNIALKLAKTLNKNPMDIANNIVKLINEDILKIDIDSYIEDMETLLPE